MKSFNPTVKNSSASGAKRDGQAATTLKQIVKEKQMGIKLLPNCSELEVSLGDYDALFSMFSVNRREAKIRIKPGNNHNINKYVVYQFLRLEKLREDPKTYWKIAWNLMNSNSFKVLAMHKTLFGWHRKYSYWQVLKWLKETDELVSTRSTNLKFRRVYIPKGEDDWRPLGVPSEPWRIYLNMYAALMRWFLLDKLPKEQHGYQATKGILTAWQQIITKVLKSPDIYEFDLKNFFDSINTTHLLKILMLPKSYGGEGFSVPSREIGFLRKLFNNTPSFCGEQLLDETAVENQRAVKEADEIMEQAYMVDSTINYPKALYDESRDKWKELFTEWADCQVKPENYLEDLPYRPSYWTEEYNREIWKGWFYGEDDLFMDESDSDPKGMNIQSKTYSKELEDKLGNIPPGHESYYGVLYEFYNEALFKLGGYHLMGVPQGTPISPILSILSLIPGLMNKRATVMYADDGLIHGNCLGDTPFPLNAEIIDSNINQNKKKSGWVKRNGKWLTTLKFLGLEYDPFKEEFRAATRNGSVLVFSEEKQFMIWLKDSDKYAQMFGQPIVQEGTIQRTDHSLQISETPHPNGSLAKLLSKARELWTNLKVPYQTPEEREPKPHWAVLPKGKKWDSNGWSSGSITGRKPLETNLKNAYNEYVEAMQDKETWQNLFKSKFLGFVISRLQNKEWNPEIEQDFRVKFERGSWMDEKSIAYISQNKIDSLLTVFNSSTFASHALLEDLNRREHYKVKISRIKSLETKLRLLGNSVVRFLLPTKPQKGPAASYRLSELIDRKNNFAIDATSLVLKQSLDSNWDNQWLSVKEIAKIRKIGRHPSKTVPQEYATYISKAKHDAALNYEGKMRWAPWVREKYRMERMIKHLQSTWKCRPKS